MAFITGEIWPQVVLVGKISASLHQKGWQLSCHLFGVNLHVFYIVVETSEPRLEISNTVLCATSKNSDPPAHTRSLIRAFASHLIIL